MLAFAITHRRKASTARDTKFYIEAESAACADLAARHVLKAFFRRIDGRGFVMFLEAEDEARLRRLLDELPLVSAGVADYRIVCVEPCSAIAGV